MKIPDLRWREACVLIAAIALLGAMTGLDWYRVYGIPGFNAWTVFSALDIVLLGAALAAGSWALLTVAVGVDRRPALLGRVALILAGAAVLAVLYGIIAPPTPSGGSFYIDPSSVERAGGLWVGLIASLFLLGSVALSAEAAPAIGRPEDATPPTSRAKPKRTPKPPKPTPPKPKATPSRRRARPSLNSATEEDLRTLGLSITQARRVLRYRAELGGFSSFEEFDRVPGLTKAMRADLRQKLIL